MSDPRRCASIVALAAAAFGLCVPALAACPPVYASRAVFPPEAEPIETLTGARLRQLAGNKGWGLAEDVTVAAGSTGPILTVKLPEGSVDHKNKDAPMGGMGFRWRPAMPAGTTAACLSYSVRFAPDFPFNKGGKLPGLMGGDAPAGGKDVDGLTGFSTRYMWRKDGAGEVYAYIPGKPDGRGMTIERGAWTFPRGRWVKMEQEIVLNTPGAPDGLLRVWIDGELKLAKADMVFRNGDGFGIDGVMADVFFGGKTADWAAPSDTWLQLTAFTLAWH